MASQLLDPLLVGYINEVTDEIAFYRKSIYLLSLWYASVSRIPVPEIEGRQGFTVPALESICQKFLRLDHFERTRAAYEVLDGYVKIGAASRKREDSKSFYSITDDGSARAVAVVEEYRRAMEVDRAMKKGKVPLIGVKHDRVVLSPEQRKDELRLDYLRLRGVKVMSRNRPESLSEKMDRHLHEIIVQVGITEGDVALFAPRTE